MLLRFIEYLVVTVRQAVVKFVGSLTLGVCFQSNRVLATILGDIVLASSITG
jgi:hypothetical protein